MNFDALPREGESLKLANRQLGDYFAFRVCEVTHREGQRVELTLDPLPPRDGKGAAFDEVELDEYITSYIVEGWVHCSTVPNPSFQRTAAPPLN